MANPRSQSKKIEKKGIELRYSDSGACVLMNELTNFLIVTHINGDDLTKLVHKF